MTQAIKSKSKGFFQLARIWFFLHLVAILSVGLHPKPSLAAEKIDFFYGPLTLSLSIDALETYVQDGTITREFGFYAGHMGTKTLGQLRQLLQRSFDMDSVAVYRLTQTSMMADLLQGVGQFVNTPSRLNGFYAIRSALVLAAAEKDNWTLIDVMRHFPTESISIDAKQALEILNKNQ
ncbi:MAG: alpha/beta hydrolase [Cyanothece sp. SIO1E1]|nr:alpha/beta hydrolase [Cyanothece sp. SIO1E1]